MSTLLDDSNSQKQAEESISIPADRRTFDVWVVLAVVLLPAITYGFTDILWPRLHPTNPPVLYSFLNTVVMLCGWAVLVGFLIERNQQPASTFGISRPKWVIDFFFAIGLTAVNLQTIRILEWLLRPAIGDHLIPAWEYQLAAPPRSLGEMILSISELLAVGFVEEFVWRSYLLTRFEAILASKMKALLLTSVLFGFAHLYQGPLGIVTATAVGLVLGTTMLSVRRLWPLALAHGLLDILLVSSHW